MPKTIYLPEKEEHYSSNGISVTYTKSTKMIYISGWYDSYVGIEGELMPLKELFDRLGIVEKDLKGIFDDK